MIIVAVAGDQLFDWVTSGRYRDISLLFLAFYAVAVIASVDSILDILVKLLEESRIYPSATSSCPVRSCWPSPGGRKSVSGVSLSRTASG